MTMVETPVPTRDTEVVDKDDNHNDDDICHLYYPSGSPTTMCGIPAEQDPHGTIHGGKHLPFNKGQVLACPECGATLCMTCALRAS